VIGSLQTNDNHVTGYGLIIGRRCSDRMCIAGDKDISCCTMYYIYTESISQSNNQSINQWTVKQL